MSADPGASGEAVLVAADAALSTSSPLASVPVCPAGGSADSLEWAGGELWVVAAMSAGGEEASSSLLGDGEAVAAKSIPVSVSFLHSALCGDCNIVAGRVVSEEGRAPPVSQEALRPQPANGLRQSPRLPGEPLPVSVVEASIGGGLPAGGGGLLPDARVGGGD
ncbi:hypothetical protein Dimus_036770, partial [Dionaea muscipula]